MLEQWVIDAQQETSTEISGRRLGLVANVYLVYLGRSGMGFF